jgi:hypothetical protein
MAPPVLNATMRIADFVLTKRTIFNLENMTLGGILLV